VGSVDVRVPARDRAVLGREQEEGRTRLAVLRDDEVGRMRVQGVERLAVRRSDCTRAGGGWGGNRYLERLGVPGVVIQRGQAGVVVGYPDRRVRADRGAPRVL